MNKYHIPALLQEVITALNIQFGKKYIDATLGGGGHTRVILENGAIVLGIDQDDDALLHAQENFQNQIADGKLVLALGNFRNIKKIAEQNGFEQVHGILFDLGVSSRQLDNSEKGFSFRFDGKLDMRMGNVQKTAFEVVNFYSENDLTYILETYGEEENAQKIAEAIIQKRKEKKIETTRELKEIIESVSPRRGDIHPATKTFQAIRIEVNDELNAIREALKDAMHLVTVDGVIAVISFHSLEDRIIKRVFNKWEGEGFGRILVKKPIQPGETELSSNPRARSAKLRVFIKN